MFWYCDGVEAEICFCEDAVHVKVFVQQFRELVFGQLQLHTQDLNQISQYLQSSTLDQMLFCWAKPKAKKHTNLFIYSLSNLFYLLFVLFFLFWVENSFCFFIFLYIFVSVNTTLSLVHTLKLCTSSYCVLANSGANAHTYTWWITLL